MARVTVEDCLRQVENMYELVMVATRRTRQLYQGAKPLVKANNRNVVVALREIAAGKVHSSFSPNAPKREEAAEDDFSDLHH